MDSPTLQTYPWPLLRPAHWREGERGGGEGSEEGEVEGKKRVDRKEKRAGGTWLH